MAVYVVSDYAAVRNVRRGITGGFVIQFENGTTLTLGRGELDDINQRVAALNADVAEPILDHPDDMPASLVEAQAVDE